jgi:hypothetical protein
MDYPGAPAQAQAYAEERERASGRKIEREKRVRKLEGKAC